MEGLGKGAVWLWEALRRPGTISCTFAAEFHFMGNPSYFFQKYIHFILLCMYSEHLPEPGEVFTGHFTQITQPKPAVPTLPGGSMRASCPVLQPVSGCPGAGRSEGPLQGPGKPEMLCFHLFGNIMHYKAQCKLSELPWRLWSRGHRWNGGRRTDRNNAPAISDLACSPQTETHRTESVGIDRVSPRGKRASRCWRTGMCRRPQDAGHAGVAGCAGQGGRPLRTAPRWVPSLWKASLILRVEMVNHTLRLCPGPLSDPGTGGPEAASLAKRRESALEGPALASPPSCQSFVHVSGRISGSAPPGQPHRVPSARCVSTVRPPTPGAQGK